MKTAIVLVCWLLLTAAAAHFVPDREQPQPIAYTRPPDDLQRDFPTNDTSPGQAAHWLRTVQFNTLSTQPRARSAPSNSPSSLGLRPSAPRSVVAPNGTCAEWVAAAGIVDTASAFRLIGLENSTCDPYRYNGQGSGACGVAQELPCGKSGCALGDGACQVKWMDEYVHDRYGSWANAVAFRLAEGWY